MKADLFCPKCGSIMLFDRDSKKMKCGNCGFNPRKKTGTVVFKDKIELNKDQEIEVQSKKVETLPKVREECSKCACKSAYYWTLQTRSSDESETRFFECVKCGHRWRSND